MKIVDIREYREPEPRASAGQAKLVAEHLRQRPGESAIIEEYDVPVEPENATPEQKAAFIVQQKKVRAKASSRASLIKQGRVSAFQSLDKGWPGTFTAVSRTENVLDAEDQPTGKKVIRVYAKYRGEEFAVEPKSKAAAKLAPEADAES
jgi:hypothetical protein